MEEFEKSVGYSPVVKELMRRENISKNLDDGRKINANSYLSKSFRNSKRRGVALLRNIKGVANSMGGLIVDKEREPPSTADQPTIKNSTSKWMKVRQHGKSIKEFTALHLCQEIQAHEGSIWTIRFSQDARYLASAGEDRIVHVWEVQECEVMLPRPPDDLNSAGSTPLHPMAENLSDRPPLSDLSLISSERRKERSPLAELSPMPSERKKRGKASNKKKGNLIPDYVYVPETVFSLSEKPVCSFTGHLDDVLDLSWSKSQVSFSPLYILKAQTPLGPPASGEREATGMEKSKAERSSPLATVEDIRRRLVRPPSLHSPSSTSSTRARDDITSSDSSHFDVNSTEFQRKREATKGREAVTNKRLEDYLDPVLLSSIRAKIGGKRKRDGEMKLKEFEFQWPIDELKALMSEGSRSEEGMKRRRNEAVDLGDDDIDHVIRGVGDEDEDEVSCSPFQRLERTALKLFKG